MHFTNTDMNYAWLLQNNVPVTCIFIVILCLAKQLNYLGYIKRNGKLSDYKASPSFYQVTLLLPEQEEHQ